MSVSDKVGLVEKHKGAYGLNTCCRALSLLKGTLHYHRHCPSDSVSDARLKDEIVTIIKQHPDYGYRRIKEELADRIGWVVNHKRLRNILATYELSLPRHLPKPSRNPILKLIQQVGQDANLVKGRTVEPLSVFCTDFTELIYHQGRKKA